MVDGTAVAPELITAALDFAGAAPSTRAVPSVADAKRAVAVLANAGAGCVLLHGSVSRGVQTPGSDIDLIAIFDDLGDYSERPALAARLRREAGLATGWHADVLVTDWPEWRCRTTKMLTAFERVFADGAITLLNRPPLSVTWDKPIGRADMDIGEAMGTLRHAVASLDVVESLYRGTEEEKRLRSSGHPDNLHDAAEDRRWKVAGQAHDAIEHGLKSVIHATSTTPAEVLYRDWDYKTHRLHHLVDLLEGSFRDSAAQLLEPVRQPSGSVTDYHTLSNYPDEAKEWQYPTEDTVESFTRCAAQTLELATTAIEQAAHHQDIKLRPDWTRRLTQARQCTTRIQNLLAATSSP